MRREITKFHRLKVLRTTGPSTCSCARLQWWKSASLLVFRHHLNALTASSVLVAGLQPGSTARLFCDSFNSLNIRERIHLPQGTAAQDLRSKPRHASPL